MPEHHSFETGRVWRIVGLTLALQLLAMALPACERVPVLNDPPLAGQPAAGQAISGQPIAGATGSAGQTPVPSRAGESPAPWAGTELAAGQAHKTGAEGAAGPAHKTGAEDGPAHKAAATPRASSMGGPMGKAASPQVVRLDKITLSDALLAPQRFEAGMMVSAERDLSGQMRATLQAVGQNKEVAVQGQADFYALSHRPDVIVMHDRYCEWMDTIRIFTFSTTGVTERACSHAARGQGYLVQLFRDFELVGKDIAVTEDLSGGKASNPPVRKRFAVPLD